MTGVPSFIGFLEDKDALRVVDEDFRELVKLTYTIPGFGTFGVSCSGHFYQNKNPCEKGTFWPIPHGELGFAALPQMNHVPNLLNLIIDETKKDLGARFMVKNELFAREGDVLKEDISKIDLSKYKICNTKNGLYMVLFGLDLGDNGCLKDVEDDILPIKGNKTIYEESKKRCLEIKNFWHNLENKIRAYNLENNFSIVDFAKKEFN